MKQALVLIVTIAASVVAWWQVTASPPPGDLRNSIAEYAFSADPEEIVIAMRIKGGMVMDNDYRYVLFGDGRLQQEAKGGKELRTVHLSYLAMDDLVRIAVEGGLIGLDWKTLEEEILARYSSVFSMTDTPRLTLDFSLTSARNAEGEELGPLSSSFSCVCTPALLEEHHKDLPETRALHALTKALYRPFYPKEVER